MDVIDLNELDYLCQRLNLLASRVGRKDIVSKSVGDFNMIWLG